MTLVDGEAGHPAATATAFAVFCAAASLALDAVVVVVVAGAVVVVVAVDFDELWVKRATVPITAAAMTATMTTRRISVDRFAFFSSSALRCSRPARCLARFSLGTAATLAVEVDDSPSSLAPVSLPLVTLIVQKFGGTSVGDADRIRAVADHIARTRRQGNDVVAVVSAMGKSTDELLRLASAVSSTPPPREMDMLLTSGERISMSLLCMALADLGVPAASFTGSQAGIITDTDHTRAKILDVRPDRLAQAISEGIVPVVAGFQGVSTEKDITTLGRGGSDVTAVALAAALDASVCEIYTDVTGVFSADPRVVPTAVRLPRISFEEMLEMAATGGRVLMLRSVEFARNHHVPLHVRSSFTWEPGTWVVEEEPSMEQAIVSAVTHDASEAKVTVAGVPDRPGLAARLFRSLADLGINVDMIVQNTSLNGTTDISFTVPRVDVDASVTAAEALQSDMGFSGVSSDSSIARLSLVGAGMKSYPGVTATMFETLATLGINIEMISTSSIRISCVVDESDVEEAMRALHAAFELG